LESVKGSGIFHPLAQKSPVNGLIEWHSGSPWRCNQLFDTLYGNQFKGFNSAAVKTRALPFN